MVNGKDSLGGECMVNKVVGLTLCDRWVGIGGNASLEVVGMGVGMDMDMGVGMGMGMGMGNNWSS